jgi:hypothetical protein
VVIDLIVEGASLLVSRRSEFAAVIERGDLTGLFAELQARANRPDVDRARLQQARSPAPRNPSRPSRSAQAC